MSQQRLLLNELEDYGMGKRATSKLQRKIEEFHEAPENRDGRGVKTQVKQISTKTLKHLVRAQKICETDSDPQIRKLARRLVKASYHVNFEMLVELARTFCGQVNKHTETVRERKRREHMREVIPVSERHTVEKITTSKFLKSVGTKLHNCLRHPRGDGGRYHHLLRNGMSEYWLLSKRSAPLCVIEIDTLKRTIETCEGIGGSTPELSRSLALNICEKLEVSGDDAEAFAQVGAFRIFQHVNEISDPLEIKLENRILKIWVNESELVIKDRSTKSEKEQWSKFEKTDGHYSSSWMSEMNEGELLTLAIKFDELRNVLQRVQTVDEPSRAREPSTF